MGSYYRHTATQSVKVPYSFRCEQCLKDSGPLEAVISGSSRLNSYSKSLSGREQAKLNKMVRAALIRELRRAYQEAEEHHRYPAFADECPHCHRPQSWAIAGMKGDQFTTPIVLLGVGLVVSLGSYFFTDLKSAAVSMCLFAVCALGAAGAFVWNRIRIGSKQRKTADAMENSLPRIQWEAVRDLLDQQP